MTAETQNLANLAENRDNIVLNESEIKSHFGENLGRIQEYVNFAKALLNTLNPVEKRQFAASPISFTSNHLLFRGLTPEKLTELLKTKTFTPQRGDLSAGTGVFFTDSPLTAFTYQERSAVVVVDKEKLDLLNGAIVTVGTEAYRNKIQDLLKDLNPEEKRLAAYTVEEKMDLAYQANQGSSGMNFSVRKQQSQDCINNILKYSNGNYIETRAAS